MPVTPVVVGFTVVKCDNMKDGRGREIKVSRRYHVRESAVEFMRLVQQNDPKGDYRVRGDLGLE